MLKGKSRSKSSNMKKLHLLKFVCYTDVDTVNGTGTYFSFLFFENFIHAGSFHPFPSPQVLMKFSNG